MEAGIVWACDLPAEGITTDSIREMYDVRVNARLVNGQVLFDVISLAHEPELKGYALNIPGSWLRSSLAAQGVIEHEFNATQVVRHSGEALRTAAHLPV